MLSDAQLDAIVHNLDQLGLKPALRFRVIAALAPVLLSPEKLTAAEPVAVRPKKPARARRTGSRTRRARGPRRRKAPISLAREIAGKARRKRRPNGKSEPEASTRAQPRPLSSDVPRPAAWDPDAIALAYLRNELTKGPIAASAVDDMVERGRLSVASVDKAKEELGVVAVRLNRGRGAVVHLRLETIGPDFGSNGLKA
jgi:hypothetical protein